MSIDIRIQDQINMDNLPQDALQLLDLLNKVEVHTASLRNEIMSELRPDGNIIHLQLNDVEN